MIELKETEEISPQQLSRPIPKYQPKSFCLSSILGVILVGSSWEMVSIFDHQPIPLVLISSDQPLNLPEG